MGSFIYYVRTKGVGGQAKSVRHAYKEEGVQTCKNIPVRNGAQMGMRTYAIEGVVVSVHGPMKGEGGAKFLPFWCVRTS